MTVVCDVDDVINDLMPKTIELYNARRPSDIQEVHMEDMTDYDFFDCLMSEEAVFMLSLFKEKELWESLRPSKGSQKGLKALIDDGHKVYLATATDPDNFAWKCEWIQKFFPFINPRNIIRIIDKSLLRCDVMIDDCMDNLTSNPCERIVVDMPWNRDYSKDYIYDLYRAKDWDDIVKYVRDIERKMYEWMKD